MSSGLSDSHSGASFAYLPPTPSSHFRIYLYAAISNVLKQTAFAMGSLEAAFKAFPFLVGYNNELAEQGLGGTSWECADAWWASLLDRWEAKAGCHLPLRALRDAAGLDHEAATALVTVGLVEEDGRFGALFDALCGSTAHCRPTVGVAGSWYAAAGAGSAIPLLQNLGLVQALNTELPRSMAPLQVPPTLWDAIRGGLPRDPGVRYVAPEAAPRPATLVLPDGLLAQVAVLSSLFASGEVRTLIIRGPSHNGRRTLMAAIAAELGRGVLHLTNLSRGDDPTWAIAGPLGTLLHAMPVVHFELGPGETATFPDMGCFEGPLGFVLGREGAIAGPCIDRSLTLTVGIPDASARRELWSQALGDRLGDPAPIAEGYRATSGNIARIARLASSCAALAGRSRVDAADVRQASRALNGQVLEALAKRVEATSGDWTQLSAASQTLDELQGLERRCRHRERLFTSTGIGAVNAGVRALFCGPSGTGKTLAARLLAAQLQMDLYRVDLSAIVNKYIGETEKNLNRIFARAEELDVVLLLDEGDALLTQRTSVQTANDRYANLETNYLLQRLESFEGILIVATNAVERIDSAFQRRMDVVVGFRPPEAVERWNIWQMHLPPEHEVDMHFLTDVTSRCTITGGQIRNAVLHASLLAFESGGPVAAPHIEAAVLREYRKVGAVCPLRRAAPTSFVRQ